MKILYSDPKVSAERNCVRLSAVRKVILDKDEAVPAGTPKAFDESIFDAIDASMLKKYYICHEKLLESSCNIVTEHKKVWGLQSIGKGECDIAYTVSGKRIYVGIKAASDEGAVSNIEIYAPENALDLAEICGFLKEKECRFSSKEYTEAFAEIVERNPETMIFQYFCDLECGVYLYTKQANALLGAIAKYPFPKESETVFRKRAFWG